MEGETLVFFGRSAAARALNVSENWFGQLQVPADAACDGRPIWKIETLMRVKAEREQRSSAREGAA